MKKLLFFATMLSMALFSCTSDDEGNVVGWKPGAEPVISSMLKANFNGGSMIVSSTGYLQSKGMLLSRTLDDYATPAAFAAEAAAVNAYEPTFKEEPSIPENANDLKVGDDLYWKGDHYALKVGEYIADGSLNVYIAEVEGDGYADIYVPSGVTMNVLNTGGNHSKTRYFVMSGATLTFNAGVVAAPVYNWGTLKLEVDVYPNAVVENYGTLLFAKDDNNNNLLKLQGTLYTNKDLEAVVSNDGNLYVDGNFNAQGSFGLSGKLYVSKTMTGNININNRLAAHVKDVVTDGAVIITAGSQLYVEDSMTAASFKPDGKRYDNSGNAYPSEFVVKNTAKITGNVEVANATKGYFEILECDNYKANTSNVWVGCKSIVLKLFELNGGNKWNGEYCEFTLANGCYLNAGSANFADDTKMHLMSNAFFEVDGKLQLNNADRQNFDGEGTKPAIIKANTIGANFEDFSYTFTGKLGVDFEDWARESSTGLIDEFKNLATVSGLVDAADYASIAKSDCNPGFTGSKVPTTPPAVEPVKTTYEVHYVVMDNGEYVDIATADTGIDANVGDNPKPGLTAKTVDGYTFSGQKNGPDALVEDAAQNKFYLIYNKNEESEQPTTPPATDPDPTPINCGVTITLPVDIKGEWIAQADDFAIHNGDYLYENIAAGTVDVEDPNYVTDTGHNSIQNYVVVNAGERVTISIEDLCAMYEAYRGKTKICDDEKSVYFGKEVSYMDEEGIFTIETYIWPCKKTTESDGVNDVVKIYPVPATEYGVIADGVDGKYLVGGENTYETYLANNKYLVRAQAYQSYNGGGQGAAMTSYIKVTFHIQDITPKSAE